ncbi:secretoglobin family 1D member 2-like [Sturnira hondurensis]|uniref:secretoglobin family 1D member 2-like n=1 Tax=Sturnira hondurensis TaxID=192404 RepID=UPI0018797B09|nr:secretoglobin family 1D member 2-like [Sturnira hondurensis]
MRLSLCVLLVTLALCCYEGNAKVCPAVISEFRSFFFDPINLYKTHLQMFAPPKEAVEAIVNVKQCVGHRSLEGRERLYNFLKNMASKCNNN